jgi:Lon protease-like protein
MMSELLPLFPLPNVVLFPNVFLPLHIFEARYRDMVADALEGDRMIGMVLLRPGWEPAHAGHPPVYPVGCSGLITHVDRLADGRFNIVLRGVERFRIVTENLERRYRRAAIERLPERMLQTDDLAIVRHQRAKLEALLAPAERAGGGVGGAASMGDEDLVNALAQYLDLEPIEKQALLEQGCLRSRAESLVELIEMKMMAARHPCPPGAAH